jgi:AcrR family transcriptional regulator
MFVCTTHNESVTHHAYPRATRAAGQQTRRRLLDAGSRLFAARGLADVSAAEIAREAGAFPSQVTYYFGSKEGLFVEAACRGVLRAAADVERAGAARRSPRSYVRAVVHTALDSPALLSFVQAALLVRGRQELAPLVRETFQRLHSEAERAIAENLAARGWQIRAEPAAEARGFWAAILGVAVEGATESKPFEPASAEAAVDVVLNLYLDPDRAGAA